MSGDLGCVGAVLDGGGFDNGSWVLGLVKWIVLLLFRIVSTIATRTRGGRFVIEASQR